MDFKNAGIMRNGLIYTEEVTPKEIKYTALNKIVQKDGVDEKYYIGNNLKSIYSSLESELIKFQNQLNSGFVKNSNSICSNSLVLKMKLPGVISFLKDFPICPIPKGTFLRDVL